MHGKISSAGSFQEQLSRNVILIERFEVLQDRIEILVSNTTDEEAYHQCRKLWNNFDFIGEIRDYFQRARVSSVSTVRLANTSTPMSETTVPLRLPPISLPSFHDELGEWIFHDSFESMVNRNESLTNIERFHYLKFALKSKTSRVLRSLAMSDDNYMTARKFVAWSPRGCIIRVDFNSVCLTPINRRFLQ